MGRTLATVAVLCALACESRLVLVDPPPGSCNPQNCLGCCDTHNTCLAGGTQSNAACGVDGHSCFPCATGTECTNGVCKSPGPCASCGNGCCFGISCQPGTDDLNCGGPGELCGSCQGKQHCLNRVCTSCGPSNCSGCCDFFGDCVQGDSDSDCGSGGSSCDNCGLGQCVGGTCR